MDRILLLTFILVLTGGCSTRAIKNKNPVQDEKTIFTTNPEGKGPEIIVELIKGKSFYYPLFAIWIEDTTGKYLQTLYVAKSVATGIFRYAVAQNNKWITAEKRAPQTLPYWAHKRGIQASDGLYMPDSKTAVPDAYTGATPLTGFIMNSRADGPLPERFKVMLEINQNWDWNDFWTNDKYPDDENYMWSCQPALVYESVIDTNSDKRRYKMIPVGHSHYSGQNGELFPDLSTLTTAMHIADSVIVSIK